MVGGVVAAWGKPTQSISKNNEHRLKKKKEGEREKKGRSQTVERFAVGKEKGGRTMCRARKGNPKCQIKAALEYKKRKKNGENICKIQTPKWKKSKKGEIRQKAKNEKEKWKGHMAREKAEK